MLRACSASKAACLALLFCAPLAHAAGGEVSAPLGAPPTPAPSFSADRVIVEWASGADQADRVEARDDADVASVSMLGAAEFQLVRIEPGQNVGEALASLRDDPSVLVAERDGFSAPNSIPNDPFFASGELWGLQNDGTGVNGFVGAIAGDDIDAPAAWDRAVGSPSIVIADIDTGYRFDSPDLGPVAWNNPAETANGLDDNGNGIADDLHGADFVGSNADASILPVDGDPTDDNLISGGHGVHTAGTMGAAGDNGTGITGVAQNVRIMPLRVCANSANSGNEARCPTSSQIAAINYAGVNGARVANMSLGGTSSSQTMVNAFAANPQTLFIISAGNDAQNNESVHHYPCDYTPQTQASPPAAGAIDNIVCVAATNQADGLASFSDWGATSVDLGAPGTETLSTYPVTADSFSDDFEANDFSTVWSNSGGEGFGRASPGDGPLTSFGMNDSPGAAPLPGSVHQTTLTTGAPVPAGSGACQLKGKRYRSGGTGGSFFYQVLSDGSSVFENFTSTATGGSSLVPFSTIPITELGGHSVKVRFGFTAGSSPTVANGIWLDDLKITCNAPLSTPPGYEFLQGTSMAAPHVTGAAGLLFSLEPSATVTEVKNALLAGVDAVPSLAGKTTTGGRLDIVKAMDSLEGEEPPADEDPPAAPLLISTDPVSPSNENNPKILGSTEAGSTVRIYEGTACGDGSVATGTATELASPGIVVNVPDNSSTQFSATATDAALNTSPCSGPISYIEDEQPPEAPQLTSTTPTSPANDAFPRINGSAESGSTIKIYPGTECKGSVAATGTAEDLDLLGIVVHVPNDSTVQFAATATDAAGNTSSCSASISYTNSSPFVVEIVEGPPDEAEEKARRSLERVFPPAIQPVPTAVCKVPKLAGKTLGQAKAALSAAHCALGKVKGPKAKKGHKLGPQVVKSSTPATDAKPASGNVDLTLGPKPKPKKHHH